MGGVAGWIHFAFVQYGNGMGMCPAVAGSSWLAMLCVGEDHFFVFYSRSYGNPYGGGKHVLEDASAWSCLEEQAERILGSGLRQLFLLSLGALWSTKSKAWSPELSHSCLPSHLWEDSFHLMAHQGTEL